MKYRKYRVNYKAVNALSAVLGVLGLVSCGFLNLFETVNAGFIIVAILALGLVAGGFAVKLILYRCQACGALLPLRTFITPSYCPSCGKKLES